MFQSVEKGLFGFYVAVLEGDGVVDVGARAQGGVNGELVLPVHGGGGSSWFS